MNTLRIRVPKRGAAAVAGLAASLALAACVAPQGSTPERVKTENPSVTYDYANDEQLVTARDEAVTYCSRFQAVPQTVNFGPVNADGTRSVVFECVSAPPPPQTVTNPPPNLTYTYRTDEELLEASARAQSFCARQGTRATSTITTNTDGSRTAAFSCVP